MSLRDYQVESIEKIRSEFTSGKKKVLLWLATGSGKTVVFCEMIKSAEKKGKNTLVVVRGRKLVDQASERLMREDVSHGVLMSGHWNYRPHLAHQVASIDTLISRRLRPKADLIIIDEAHMAGSKGYKEFLALYPEAFIVACTATPYVDKGLSHIAETVVHPITMIDLIDKGYLVPFRYFAPTEPDLTDVKVSSSTKDYLSDQLEGAMNAGGLSGKIIDHWKKIASDRQTICFAVNIHHSKTLVERFKENGINAEHCDADTSDVERDEIIARLKSGETQIVCNVGIFGTGIDIPSVGAIIMARPTKSRNLFIQQAGRGTRISDGKSDCILLDHAGNIRRHGFPTDETDVNLEANEKEFHAKKSKICDMCFVVYRGPFCPECGAVEKPIPIIGPIEESDDQLVEITETDPILRSAKALRLEAKYKGRKPSWAHYKLIDRYGYGVSKPYLPYWFVEFYEKKKA